MKPFDKAAAMRGARVCTREGFPVRILCFDLKVDKGRTPILAEVHQIDSGLPEYAIYWFFDDGKRYRQGECDIDLMMADDDYLEKLGRGEYGTPVWQEPHRIMTPDQIAAQPFASIADEGYWRKMYAGMAMLAIIQEDP